MSEIEKFTTVQYKKYREAIARKEDKEAILQAKIFRVALLNKEGFDSFINAVEGKADEDEEKSREGLSGKQIKEMGLFGKKR